MLSSFGGYISSSLGSLGITQNNFNETSQLLSDNPRQHDLQSAEQRVVNNQLKTFNDYI